MGEVDCGRISCLSATVFYLVIAGIWGAMKNHFSQQYEFLRKR